ncbi:hypothetical protein [Nonomuraea endophytica]|uniref:hypothetical protein n=1 Tax=Nonomuraea endophytica TaxID=714136 RepID=UPI0037C52D8B
MTHQPAQDTASFDEWCVVELLGHRRLGARVREATIAGASFLRLDVPATTGAAAMTQYVSPSSVYALTPTSEELATALAEHTRPAPVSRFEINPAPAIPVHAHHDEHDDDPFS